MENDIIDTLILDWKNERPELDVAPMAIVGRILSLGKTLEKRASMALSDSGIYYTDLDVLATLRRSGKPYTLTPTQLMQSVLITSGAMTALLDRLTKLELIYRSVDENDKRVKRAVLTKKGIKIINKAIETRFEEAHESVDFLSRTEQEELARLLKKMMFNIREL